MSLTPVIPAKAGIHLLLEVKMDPGFAGMTEMGVTESIVRIKRRGRARNRRMRECT